MPRTISATEARVHFGELMRTVADTDEPVIVERGGKPQIVVISVDRYKRLAGSEPEPEDWWERAKRTSEQIARERGDRPWPDIAELINQAREERDAEILDAVLRR